MAAEIDRILRLEVPIIVEIGNRRLDAEAVVAWTPGAIIELPKAADEELELKVNNKAIGAGVAVKVGENFGLRISFIGDLRTRIEALGGGAAVEPPAAFDADEVEAGGMDEDEHEMPASEAA